MGNVMVMPAEAETETSTDVELVLEEITVSEEEIGQLYLRERQDVTH